MDKLVAGLIGSYIQKTRLPRALKLLCDEAGIGFEFELIDTHGIADFDFGAKVDDLKQRNWSGVTVERKAGLMPMGSDRVDHYRQDVHPDESPLTLRVEVLGSVAGKLTGPDDDGAPDRVTIAFATDDTRR